MNDKYSMANMKKKKKKKREKNLVLAFSKYGRLVQSVGALFIFNVILYRHNTTPSLLESNSSQLATHCHAFGHGTCKPYVLWYTYTPYTAL